MQQRKIRILVEVDFMLSETLRAPRSADEVYHVPGGAASGFRIPKAGDQKKVGNAVHFVTRARMPHAAGSVLASALSRRFLV